MRTKIGYAADVCDGGRVGCGGERKYYRGGGKTWPAHNIPNFLFNDPHYGNSDILGKQIGGKIGIIQDPFGTFGAPVYLGATTPIPNAALNQLTLDQNGMLYATAFVEDTSGQYTGGYASDLMYNSMFAWNASQLIQAALNAQQSGRELIVPIDRTNAIPSLSTQYPAATPARYDTTGNGNLFGWIYGVGTYSAAQNIPTLSLQNVPYLQALAPSVFTEAKSAAVQAHVPVPLDTSNGTWNTFLIRTGAQLVSMESSIIGSAQALFGQDKSQSLAKIEEANQVLNTIGYDTSGSGLAANLASAAQATEGLIGGMAMMGTNAAGVMFRDVSWAKTLYNGNITQFPAPTDFLKMADSNATISEKINYTTMAFLKYNPVTLGVEGVYKMGSALIAGNWEALRNESYNMLALFSFMKFFDTPASKRELQRAVKQVDFLEQQLKRGKIEVSPLRDIEFKPEGTKGYAIEAPKYDANGLPLSDGTAPRIVDVRDFAKACDGILDVNANGEAVFKVCFAAGTLVHTKNGLVPIEKIKIGDSVLSQPEQKGQIAYRPVVNTVVHEDKEVYLVQFHAQDKPELGRVVASGNHPFWVQGEGWMAVEYLQPGQVLELQDGSHALVHSVGKVRHTQVPGIGWAADDRNDVGVILDLSDGLVRVASEEITRKVLALDLGEAFKTRVYNFEVEEFHTYYVETLGVWVHNTNCTGEAAVEAGFKKTTYEAQCFSGDTFVVTTLGHTQISDIEPGFEVLSRCEKTGEIGFRKVTKCFFHRDAKVYDLVYFDEDGRHAPPVTTTAEHPFWVKGRGWTAVRDIKPGDVIETCNDIKYAQPHWGVHVVKLEIHEGATITVAGVFGGDEPGYTRDVYNLEVEEFHTYFVGWEGLWVHNTKAKPVTVTVKPKVDIPAEVTQNKFKPSVDAINGLKTRLADLESRLSTLTDAEKESYRDTVGQLGAVDSSETLANAGIPNVNLPDSTFR